MKLFGVNKKQKFVKRGNSIISDNKSQINTNLKPAIHHKLKKTTLSEKSKEIQNLLKKYDSNVPISEIQSKLNFMENGVDDGNGGQDLYGWIKKDCNGCGNGKVGGCIHSNSNSSSCLNGILDVSIKWM